MKDCVITPAGMTTAERAVSYILQRMKVDANLRWYLVGTESFAKLCAAEAERAGVSAEALQHEFSRPNGEADIMRARFQLEKIADACLEVRQCTKSAAKAIPEILDIANE